ncbi:MAG: radical SAM protein [Candidatus Helarchaeales archaeon]
MKILLVEPDYHRGKPKPYKPLNDEVLWYPPVGLLKLAFYHRRRGDDVTFISGCEPSIIAQPSLFHPGSHWDRIYITTLFTFQFDNIVKTIKFYLDAVGGTVEKVFVGGIMASLMPDELYKATGVYPVSGLLTSARMIGFKDDTNIDQLPCDYSVLDSERYAINDTYYGYTTRGCTNKCPWCGVPIIEPQYFSYIDIKPFVLAMRKEYGDRAVLRLMDNNFLASSHLTQLVDDLLELGYGRGESTDSNSQKARSIDFNQGLDATHVNKENMELLSQLNIKPMRIAFDRVSEREAYTGAIRLAVAYGVESFSNYMLYNFRDTPRDLYERLVINIRLNEEFVDNSEKKKGSGKIFSYPMRYAPINHSGGGDPKFRDYVVNYPTSDINWHHSPVWTKRFIRNIEIMKGAAHGAISSTPTLAWRTIGETFKEFVTNLYMPEELLRNRNRHERRVYDFEPKRNPGSGMVEEFRSFILQLLESQDENFIFFHNTVSPNSVTHVRKQIGNSPTKEIKQWLKMYLRK